MSYDYDDEDEESGEVEVQESRTPKMNKFLHDISDWLTLATVIFLVVYVILYLFYEIALGMAHIRWVYGTFLLICLVDIAMYFIIKFAVVGGDTTWCLVYLAAIIFSIDLFANLVAPAYVLISFQLTLEHPSSGSSSLSQHSEPVEGSSDTVPVDCSDAEGIKCAVVRSIRNSIWCMYLLAVPRPLVMYGIVNILGKSGKEKARY